jgi:hypothetical protein
MGLRMFRTLSTGCSGRKIGMAQDTLGQILAYHTLIQTLCEKNMRWRDD